MRILQCKDSVFFYNTCNKTKKKSNKYKKAHQELSRGQVFYIMTFNSYSLQYYSFLAGKMGFGSLMWWEVRCRVAGLDGIGRESERVELKGESLRRKC